MFNIVILAGTVKKVTTSTPRDPKKTPSAVILVQYGKQREYTGNAVEFVNAVPVRVPPFRFEQVKDSLVEGAFVKITGKTQGVLKSVMGESSMAVELVAERIEFEDQPGHEKRASEVPAEKSAAPEAAAAEATSQE
jgi:hypothetical protein